MKLLMLLFTLLTISEAHSSQATDPNSPIVWIASVRNKGENTLYSGSDFDHFLTVGLTNNDLKLKCQFKLEKGFSQKRKLKNTTIGGEYNEMVWPTCELNGVTISLKAVGCTKSKTHFNDSESTGLTFNYNQVNFSIDCAVKVE